ncbi:MAG: hypothetical protein BRC34_13355 [Cyanobacteria bacterium QH_1_48_107]|nr:MAG: hypothetical protein BRC34_13355 [Cyanobacteria bacterium QH_1_48_107]
MELGKKMSLALTGTGFMVLAAAGEAQSFELTLDKTIGSQSGGPGQLALPQGVDIQEGSENIYVADSEKDRIAVFNQQGEFQSDFGQDQIGDEPAPLTFNDETGQLFVGDVGGNEIDVFNPDGTYDRSFGEFTVGTERPFEGPAGMAFTPDSETLYAANYAGDEILEFDPETGEQLDSIGVRGDEAGQLYGPAAIDVSDSGNLYVSEQLNSRIQVLNPEGESIRTFGESRFRPVRPSSSQPVPADIGPGDLSGPVDLTLDEDNNVYVADTLNNRIQAFDSQGNYITQFKEFPADPPGYFWTVGAKYENGKLYTSDFFNNRVVVADKVPEPSSVLGTALLGIGGAAVIVKRRLRQKLASRS